MPNETQPGVVVPDAAQTFAQVELELGVGMVPRIFRLLEGQPSLLVHLWGQFRTVVLQGELPRTLKEMVGLVVANETGCEYVRTVHLHSLSLQGITGTILETIRTGTYRSPYLSDRLQAVLAFAQEAARSRSACASVPWSELLPPVSDALEAAGLTEGERFELVATVALFEQICAVANLLALDPAQP